MRRLCIWSFASIIIVVGVYFAIQKANQPTMAARIEQAESILNAYQQLNKFNGVALIAVDGKILLEKGFGIQNVGTNSKLMPSHKFRIYSVTKSFTSTLILQLVEQQKLALDDKLGKFYPDIQNADSITIEHLLSHTSGLYEYTREANFQNTEANLVELLKTKPADFAPGSGWSYCNSGYCLLGHIAAKVTGMTYEQAIEKQILVPLKMHASGFSYDELADDEKAIGYEIFTNDQKKVGSLKDQNGPFAAGAIVATAGDLYRFTEGLREHKLLTEGTLNKAQSSCSQNSNYGLGWQIEPRGLLGKVVFHSGGASGFRSLMAYIPSQQHCVILLNNHENAELNHLSRTIFDILDGKNVAIPKDVKLEREELENLTGAYIIKAPEPMLIRASILDEHLAVEVGGQPKCILLAQDRNTFVQLEASAKISIERDKSKLAERLLIHQGSSTMVAERVDAKWGILGSATSVGWESSSDLPMMETTQKNVWTASNIELRSGELKFRFYNNWQYNYGDNEADGLGELHGKNIVVKDGVYDITLDLRDDVSPTYRITPSQQVE